MIVLTPRLHYSLLLYFQWYDIEKKKAEEEEEGEKEKERKKVPQVSFQAVPGCFLGRMRPIFQRGLLEVLALTILMTLFSFPFMKEHEIVEIRPKTAASAPTLVQQYSKHKQAEPCYDSRGLVVVVTRSVVSPKKRRQRLAVIAKTWGHDLVRAGASIVILSKDPATECKNLLHGMECLRPPMDLVAQKFEVFDWVMSSIVLRRTEPIVRHMVWCNDHSYIIVGNLLQYLRSVSPAMTTVKEPPLYAGKVLVAGGRRFKSGAAGIILNRVTMLLLRDRMSQNSPMYRRECFPPELQNQTQKRVQVSGNPSFGKVKEPGLILADCLYLAGILPNRTRAGGAESTEDRFHSFGPQRLVAGTTDKWYLNYHGACPSGDGCGKDDIGQRLSDGLACCASDTISFVSRLVGIDALMGLSGYHIIIIMLTPTILPHLHYSFTSITLKAQRLRHFMKFFKIRSASSMPMWVPGETGEWTSGQRHQNCPIQLGLLLQTECGVY